MRLLHRRAPTAHDNRHLRTLADHASARGLAPIAVLLALALTAGSVTSRGPESRRMKIDENEAPKRGGFSVRWESTSFQIAPHVGVAWKTLDLASNA
jgi:hypothetical protein